MPREGKRQDHLLRSIADALAPMLLLAFIIESQCSRSPDGLHCDHWFDGDACHYCDAPALTLNVPVANLTRRR